MVAPPKAPPVRQLRGEDLPAVERYDRARGGADRRPDFALLASSGNGFAVDGPDGALAGFLFFRSLPARVVIGPGIAESADVMADLIDAVAVALPGRAAVIRASAAAPSVLLRAFARGFRVDHLGNLMVKGPYTPPPAQLYALFPESLYRRALSPAATWYLSRLRFARGNPAGSPPWTFAATAATRNTSSMTRA